MTGWEKGGLQGVGVNDISLNRGMESEKIDRKSHVQGLFYDFAPKGQCDVVKKATPRFTRKDWWKEGLHGRKKIT